ncbi:hypothetical protein WJX77_010358 [Trebouxia sp. C0004]
MATLSSPGAFWCVVIYEAKAGVSHNTFVVHSGPAAEGLATSCICVSCQCRKFSLFQRLEPLSYDPQLSILEDVLDTQRDATLRSSNRNRRQVHYSHQGLYTAVGPAARGRGQAAQGPAQRGSVRRTGARGAASSDAEPPRSVVTAPRTAGVRRPARQRARATTRMARDNQEVDAAPDANQSRHLSTMDAVDDIAASIRASTGGLLTQSGIAQGPAPSVPQFVPATVAAVAAITAAATMANPAYSTAKVPANTIWLGVYASRCRQCLVALLTQCQLGRRALGLASPPPADGHGLYGVPTRWAHARQPHEALPYLQGGPMGSCMDRSDGQQ